MSCPGIDYGLGRTNINPQTGIRYGVISQHSVTQAWCDSAEPDYGKPQEVECPSCGKEYGLGDQYDWGDTFECECGESFEIELFDMAEPIGWYYEGDGYKLEDCLDADIFVLDSPFYTFAQFCSPCVPGAGNLDHPCEDGAKCYCLGHDWFEGNKAPYPVFCVSDDSIVHPKED